MYETSVVTVGPWKSLTRRISRVGRALSVQCSSGWPAPVVTLSANTKETVVCTLLDFACVDWLLDWGRRRLKQLSPGCSSGFRSYVALVGLYEGLFDGISDCSESWRRCRAKIRRALEYQLEMRSVVNLDALMTFHCHRELKAMDRYLWMLAGEADVDGIYSECTEMAEFMQRWQRPSNRVHVFVENHLLWGCDDSGELLTINALETGVSLQSSAKDQLMAALHQRPSSTIVVHRVGGGYFGRQTVAELSALFCPRLEWCLDCRICRTLFNAGEADCSRHSAALQDVCSVQRRPSQL
ncbi:MAG: hypothetical protein OWS03_04975 [Alicyclobacillaceae bacterium]|nr:hypothetical protein [Alicyclobacillaceae bacterium]